MVVSDRSVYVGAAGIVRVPAENSATAGDIISQVKAALPNRQRHGNSLLSSVEHRFEFAEPIGPHTDLVMTDYTDLAPPWQNIRIATERSGVTIAQIQQLLNFVNEMIGISECDRKQHGLWAGSFGEERGKPLSFESFNLYNANDWIIGPATSTADGLGCSYVELVTNNPVAQLPVWFVSHAWVEPIRLFLKCLQCHANLRDLLKPAYWVCAYANNQHALQDAIAENPRKTSFYNAMHLCQGVVLVLDAKATPFLRIWCCFEEAIAVEKQSNSFLLDVAATDRSQVAHVITDGLSSAERRVLPILGLLNKSRRELAFPHHLLDSGLRVNIATAEASKAEDKTRILNSIAFPRAQTVQLKGNCPTQHANFEVVSRSLGCHFALSGIVSAYWNQCDTRALLEALQADEKRTTIQLSLTGCRHFGDVEFTRLMEHLPASVQHLRLDLGYTGLEHLNLETSNLQLTTLVVRFTGSLRSTSALSKFLSPSLRRVELWLSNLPELEDLEQDLSKLSQLQLEELVLYIHGCPRVPRESKQALWKAAQTLKRSRGRRVHVWVSIEDAGNFRTLNFLPEMKLKVCSFEGQRDVQTGGEMTEIDSKDPFPCHSCSRFHENTDGYCNFHRLHRFWRIFSSRCRLAFEYTQLLVIFLVQAAGDIESRALLVLIIFSLYPVTCTGLARAIGISFAAASIVSLSLLFASVSYAVLRFDQMQQATLELALASEAVCSQVLQLENLPYLSLVFGSAASDYPSTAQQEDVQDLRSNYLQAKRHFHPFRTALFRAADAERVRVKIRHLSDLRGQGADLVDVLYAEVHCSSLPEVQAVWQSLSTQSEAGPLSIVALWDGFAQEEQCRCSKIVVSIDGYRATVILMVSSLSASENELGPLCRLANNFGLLDAAKPRRFMLHDGVSPEHSQLPSKVGLRVAMATARTMAMMTSAYFAIQYFIRYSPAELKDGVPEGLQRFLAWSGQKGEDNGWWLATSFSAPYAVLVFVFAHDLLSRRFVTKPKLTQLLFERHFGVRGSDYDLKVVIFQFATIVLQSVGKLRLMGGITTFAIHQEIPAATVVKAAFWSFFALLALNSVYPTVLLFFPDRSLYRYMSACLDIFFDLGYVVTYLVILVIGITNLHLEVSVSGNFGVRSELGFSNSVNPVFAFPSDLLQYLAVYISIAHVCCACRSLERTLKVHNAPSEPSSNLRHVRCCLRYLYSPVLVAILIWFLFSSDFYPGHSGDFECFPCRCDDGHLQSCSLAAQLQQKQLVLPGLQSIDPMAFKPLGRHLTQLSLADGSLRTLGPGLFEHLSSLKILDLGRVKLQHLDTESFSGLDQLLILAMHGNNITTISAAHLRHLPQLEELILGSLNMFDYNARQFRFLEVGNQLTVLPPRLLQGNPRLKRFDVSGNQITDVFNSTFRGANELVSLDLSMNRLGQLPAGLFAELTSLKNLSLHNNMLTSLPEGLFAELTSLKNLSLDNNMLTSLPEGLFAQLASLRKLRLEGNHLSTLPEGAFTDLAALQMLYLSGNQFSTFPEGLFANLASLQQLVLNGNKLTTLPQGVFANLEALYVLNLADNKLSVLPEGLFGGLTALQQLGLDGNMLRTLPQGLFAKLQSLQKLFLHKNMLSMIPEGVFADLAALLDLYLMHNSLSELPERVFAELVALQILGLDNNNLSALPEGLFAGLAQLELLSLCNNNLGTLPEGLFDGLPKLKLEDCDEQS